MRLNNAILQVTPEFWNFFFEENPEKQPGKKNISDVAYYKTTR